MVRPSATRARGTRHLRARPRTRCSMRLTLSCPSRWTGSRHDLLRETDEWAVRARQQLLALRREKGHVQGGDMFGAVDRARGRKTEQPPGQTRSRAVPQSHDTARQLRVCRRKRRRGGVGHHHLMSPPLTVAERMAAGADSARSHGNDGAGPVTLRTSWTRKMTRVVVAGSHETGDRAVPTRTGETLLLNQHLLSLRLRRQSCCCCCHRTCRVRSAGVRRAEAPEERAGETAANVA